jgi:hypothetical protein
MKYSILKLSVLVFALVFTVSSCKKDDDKDPLDDDDDQLEYDTQSSQDNALAENTFNDMNSMSDQAYGGSLSSYRPADGSTPPSLLSTCATITVNTTASDTTITIDFGSNWCLCSDGRYRKGKFTVTFTGAYKDSATVITAAATSTDNYHIRYLNDTSRYIKVTGTHVVTNKGHNASGHLWYTVNVNGQLVNNFGQTLTWTSQRNREWMAGDTTATWLDDQYAITGTAHGTSFEGVVFDVAIDSANPLFVDFTCFVTQPWSCKITKGKFSLTPTVNNVVKPPRYIDFGTGACDNEANCTVNNVSFTIYVR